MTAADTLKQHALNHAANPSTWLAVLAGVGAVAQQLTQTGEPHLIMIGSIAAVVFKCAEAAHDAYVKGKKLDVERQYVTQTAQATPSLIASAKAVGIPVGYTPPAPTLDGTAPGITNDKAPIAPQPPIMAPDPNAPPHIIGQNPLPPGVSRL